MAEALHTPQRLPEFSPGKIVFTSPGGLYRVVTDFKPSPNHNPMDRRFFIEPLTDEAARMLHLAARVHNISNFNVRTVPDVHGTPMERQCLRADFTKSNLPSLLGGFVDIPEPDEDTIPSPLRMETCLKNHPDYYSFED